MFPDDTVARITEALKQEIQTQLKDHHDYLRALVQEAYLDLHKSSKKMESGIKKLRTELDALRGAETKAVEAGGVVTPIIRKQTHSS